MTRLPSVKISKLLKTILHLGFVEHRQSGSHLQLKHPDGRRVTIPVHAGKDIKRGTLSGILSIEELGVWYSQVMKINRPIYISSTHRDLKGENET